MSTKYAGVPTALIYKDDNGKKGKVLHQLLWGDPLEVIDEPDGDLARVKVRIDEGTKRHDGWMLKKDIQEQPLLEVTFVDIGQGDGCLLIMPDPEAADSERRAIVLDAGKQDNMARYIRYRFSYPSATRPKEIFAGIISHPDSDHYNGFDELFSTEGLTFKTLYHNGLVERKGDSVLGRRTNGTPRLFTNLIKTKAQLKKLLDKDAETAGRKMYPDMLRRGVDKERFDKFKNLSRDDEYLPGFTPNDDIAIEVLGPVIEEDDRGKRGLRDFGSTSFTKNGHSVVLRLRYRKVRMFLGGDLNIPSEELLLRTIIGHPAPAKEKVKERAAYISEARKTLEVDVAKSCHHGSADFSSLFLEAVNPVVTVISSGDDEPYSHPRAETLGAIGVNSRGDRPLIFSTELARSAKDAIRDPKKERADLKRAHADALKETEPTNRRKLNKAFRALVDETINRTIQVYGAIYVRTDGEKLVVAQRIERGSNSKRWDVSELHPDKTTGELVFKSKFAEE